MWNWIQSCTTKKLIKILMWALGILLLVSVVFAFLLNKSPTNLLLSFLFGLNLFLIASTFFVVGFVMFVRAEDPITISEGWFGIRKLSQGNWPRIQGIFIMIIAGLGIGVFAIMVLKIILQTF